MKPPVLPFAVALAALGLLGMMRGSALADVRVEDGGASVTPTRGMQVEHPMLPVLRVATSSTATLPDWLPTPEPGRVLAPGETARSLTVEQWRATRQFPAEVEYRMTRACWCESHLDPTQAIVDTNSHWSVGACMVQPVWWAAKYGEVPADLPGQIAQAARIYEAEQERTGDGTWPWRATRDGCEGWNAE